MYKLTTTLAWICVMSFFLVACSGKAGSSAIPGDTNNQASPSASINLLEDAQKIIDESDKKICGEMETFFASPEYIAQKTDLAAYIDSLANKDLYFSVLETFTYPDFEELVSPQWDRWLDMDYKAWSSTATYSNSSIFEDVDGYVHPGLPKDGLAPIRFVFTGGGLEIKGSVDRTNDYLNACKKIK
jgi:hypothetical protein